MRHDEVAHCAAFEREWAAFAESDLGRALADLEQAVTSVRDALARRKPPADRHALSRRTRIAPATVRDLANGHELRAARGHRPRSA